MSYHAQCLSLIGSLVTNVSGTNVTILNLLLGSQATSSSFYQYFVIINIIIPFILINQLNLVQINKVEGICKNRKYMGQLTQKIESLKTN